MKVVRCALYLVRSGSLWWLLSLSRIRDRQTMEDLLSASTPSTPSGPAVYTPTSTSMVSKVNPTWHRRENNQNRDWMNEQRNEWFVCVACGTLAALIGSRSLEMKWSLAYLERICNFDKFFQFPQSDVICPHLHFHIKGCKLRGCLVKSSPHGDIHPSM